MFSYISAMNITIALMLAAGVLTIGIPVSQWPGAQESLLHTLGSIVNNTSLEDQLEITITVVLWASNDSYNNQLVEAVARRYSYYLRLGVLHIIRPGASWASVVTTLHNTSLSLNNDLRMIQFMADNSRSLYYLHLSDDVICAPNFYFQIKSFMREIGEPWKMLEFSELGYVGKLVPVDTMHKWSVFMEMFTAGTEPLDKIFFLFRQTVLQRKKIMLKPTLFQRSSEADKWGSHGDAHGDVVRDRFFDDGSALLRGDDPEGQVLSNMVPVGQNTPEFAYRAGSQNFFWARSPSAGDWLVIIFENDVDISRVVVRTGFNPEEVEHNLMLDRLHNATVEISPKLLQLDTEKNKVPTADYRRIGLVQNGNADIQNKYHYRLTKCLQITVIADETEGVIFQQISVFVKKN